MNIVWKKIFLSCSLFAVSVMGFASMIVTVPVYAAGPTDLKTQVLGNDTETGKLYAGYQITGDATSSREKVMSIIQQILNFIYGILGMIMVGYTLYGGWLYMTAAGNDEQVSDALTIIKNAIIGLAIIVGAALITGIVVNIIVCWVTGGSAQNCASSGSSGGFTGHTDPASVGASPQGR